MVMLKKPTPAEFKIVKTGIWHLPTKEKFTAHPGKPADGQWLDGYALAAVDYDMDAVHRMGRELWIEEINERKRSR
jgi:hypothetical protein